MSKKVRKVVFPVAGLGTRFLPATKSVPKEMLPVVDRPLIQYAVDEAKEAGIEHFGRGIEANIDTVVAVVEPSLESIELARKVMDLTVSSGATFGGAVLNKVSSEEQRSYLRDRMSVVSVPVIGIIDYNDSIQTAALRGKPCPADSNGEVDRIAARLLLDYSDHYP